MQPSSPLYDLADSAGGSDLTPDLEPHGSLEPPSSPEDLGARVRRGEDMVALFNEQPLACMKVTLQTIRCAVDMMKDGDPVKSYLLFHLGLWRQVEQLDRSKS